MISMLVLMALASTPDAIRFQVDGVDREALVYRQAVSSGPAPVVFAFHGHMGNSRQASRSFQIQEAWPEAVVVYAQGLPTQTFYDPRGRGNGWSTQADESNKDIRYFDELYKAVMRSYQCDPKRVFAMGHSNGAQFMYTLWAMRGSQLAALGSCEGAGAQTVNLDPKPFFMTIGDEDALVPPRLQRKSFDKVMSVNGASGAGSPFGEKGTLYPGNQPVVLWSYHGGHQFPADSVPTMVRFFQEVSR